MKESKETQENKDIVSQGSQTETGRGLMAFEDFDRWFDDMLSRRWLNPFDVKFPRFPLMSFPLSMEVPKVDIIENDNEIKVHAALPGVKKEDLDVSLTNQTVTIKSSTRQEKKQESGEYCRREISRGEFQRTVSLPCQVNSDQAKASFKDGILEIVLPKLEKTQRKRIEIH
ncbi:MULTISPECIES: Hsp20/alpha crystallin family protein [Methylomicrobium]|uniref:Molecular chaperone (Small heat shock protein) n=1 Tax=Methylomicrobium album BG8 TaxID=686340 RepID=H8GR50_METAL|nr:MULTISPECIES: Hsp20/alpha crystallin family protein [Methylomicrobium]EIC29877.1 molecular chaperone (small heat shock protein) [Methylomicrobium album BG8]